MSVHHFEFNVLDNANFISRMRFSLISKLNYCFLSNCSWHSAFVLSYAILKFRKKKTKFKFSDSRHSVVILWARILCNYFSLSYCGWIKCLIATSQCFKSLRLQRKQNIYPNFSRWSTYCLLLSLIIILLLIKLLYYSISNLKSVYSSSDFS